MKGGFFEALFGALALVKQRGERGGGKRKRGGGERAPYASPLAAARAVRRAERWRLANAADAPPPRHIRENAADAWRQLDRAAVRGEAAERAAAGLAR